MNTMFKAFLFNKHILVSTPPVKAEERFETLFALANKFGIRVVRGLDLATSDMIRYAADMLGEYVPEPFYKGFPESVRKLTPEVRLFDQLLSYFVTYGLGDFTEARHSMFEEPFERIAFKEDTEIRDFVIMTEEEAEKELDKFVTAMLSGTRPLSREQFALVKNYIITYKRPVDVCASKDTAVRLLLDLRDLSFTRFLTLPDVIRMVEVLNYDNTGETNIRKLNLCNQDRKFITAVIDQLISETDDMDHATKLCFEKRKLWVGLLHHIHYNPPRTFDTAYRFADAIRFNRVNCSAYSIFEMEMAEGSVVSAAYGLKREKGSGAVARNLNYLLSRCKTPSEMSAVLDCLGTLNPVMSMQMLLQYRNYYAKQRVFNFVRFNRMVHHWETPDEEKRRKSVLSSEACDAVQTYMQNNLNNALSRTKAGKVYLDEDMKKIAVPLQESASSSGYGVLPRGSRLPMPEGTKLRCFTYWEKVDDIDLSAFGMTEDGEVEEFSWRDMWSVDPDEGIVFSGDETSGYNGGSEYFDIDLERFEETHPDFRYIVFANNVYTNGVTFSDCVCKAGYMIREKIDSGEVYEPKTVKTAFAINGNSSYAALFALDLKTREIVWLNITFESRTRVAGEENISFTLRYMDILDVLNVYDLFRMKAEALVSDPEEADIIVSDKTFDGIREGQEQIHSYDFEKMLTYINQR